MMLFRRLILLATTIALLLGTAAAVAAQYRWSGVDRVVALSDPHGAFEALLDTLEHAGVIDADGDWAGGETHLVVVGDMLDRGSDSRRIMDLVMKLEAQAPETGGMVHLTLGNHEVMNLVGDLRYVAQGEFAAFADEESADERERWFGRLLSTRRVQTAGEVDEEALRAEFERDRPPGFYGHRKAFGSEGKYGRWLLQRPLMVVINGTAFVHGGMPSLVGELDLDRLNDELLNQVSEYVRAVEVLNRNGMIDPAVNFYDHSAIAEGIRTDISIAPDILAALDTVVDLSRASVHDSESPLWYRGTVGCSLPVESDIFSRALDAVGAERVVIGHTPTVTRQVLSRFGGRVIEIDTGMLNAAYRGSGNALIIEGGEMTVVNEHGVQDTRPVPHPRRVGQRADALSAEVLEELLASGNIVDVTVSDAGLTTVEIDWNGTTVSARFVESPRRKGVNTELAAYRLDQMLGLEMVPVTALREVNGKEGTLQFLPKNARDEAYRAAGGQGGGAWCPIDRQWNSMYVFDVLIYNEGRVPTSMVYSPENWQLLLMGHQNAFSTKRDKPGYLEPVPLDLTGAWVEALRSLTDDRLEELLGDVLDSRRLSALGKRRDMLLDEAG